MYVNVNVIAFITRGKVNIVDTETRMVFLSGHLAKYTSHQLVCVQVFVCACNCFVWCIAVHLWHLVSKVRIYQLTPQTLQVTV